MEPPHINSDKTNFESQNKNSLNKDEKNNQNEDILSKDEKQLTQDDYINAMIENVTDNAHLVLDPPINLEVTEIGISLSVAKKYRVKDGNYLLARGKSRRESILVVKILKDLDDAKNEKIIFLSKYARNNLRVRIQDFVKLENCTSLKKVVSAIIRPIFDTIKNVKGNIFDSYLIPYFSKPLVPISKGDIISVTKGVITVDFKVLELSSNKETNDLKHGLITSDTKIDCDGSVNREEAEADFKSIGYDDIGGCRRQIAQVRELIELPLRHPQLYLTLGIKPPRGILLFGPPGTGKTLIAQAIANETGAFLFTINGPEIMSKMSGESESNLRRIFQEAEKNAPSLIFIDEIDSIAPKREKSHGEVERRIVSQLLTLMDGIKKNTNIIILGATNRPNSIDSALRRYGRFGREIEIGIPDKIGRLEILRIHTKNMCLDEHVDLEKVAENTHGFVGSDIASLCSEAAMQQIRRKIPKIDIESEKIDVKILESLKVNEKDFQYAVENVDPSSLRETVIESPNIKWSDIGGLNDVKSELKETVSYPIKYSNKYLELGMTPSRGILFYGPPGCGKTLLAKAVASECSANFISVKGPELLNMYVGESEANVRDIFDKARSSAPCIIFFDEIDSIAKSRSSGGADSAGVTERMLNQMLTEMDGISKKKNVFIIGATNRPDQLDSALLRPGRLDQLIYIPLPDLASRESILRATCNKTPIGSDVSFQDIANMTKGCSGADLAEIVQRARKFALKQSIQESIKRKQASQDDNSLKNIFSDMPDDYDEMGKLSVNHEHFKEALKTTRKSVTQKELDRYESFARSMNVNLNLQQKEDGDQEVDDLYN
ncbi:AAA+-type ATPase [Pseudoloma neurophilia]|uniref:AAA+-type ATPase n=1 Tax=Pseudoloma neurophilia TaxID=146866 RepID=A0A0R0M283_9MICR|nr:AAA+-type ATPase [Pseudoloma neurophilia]